MAAPLDPLIDPSLLRQTAEHYAVGADRRDKEMWRAILAEDCVIAGPGFIAEGREACLRSIDTLDGLFRATRHIVHQQVATVTGDRAVGETYGTAEHLLRDRDTVLVWAIRYQDQWRRDGMIWRFTERRLLLNWTETRAVEPAAITPHPLEEAQA